jgi:hypothetical protein
VIKVEGVTVLVPKIKALPATIIKIKSPPRTYNNFRQQKDFLVGFGVESGGGLFSVIIE